MCHPIRALLVMATLTLPACGGGGGGGGSTPSPNASLANLLLSIGQLSPPFDPAVTFYEVGPAVLGASVHLTATAQNGGATILVDGSPTVSGTPSIPIVLPTGPTPVTVLVTAADGVTQKGYTVLFMRGAPETQEAYLKASNAEANDSTEPPGFTGVASVSISGDTLVVGAPFEDSAATGVNGDQGSNAAGGSGAAYVFVRADGVWAQQAYLKASNTASGDAFGWSVAISGDTIVVGANGEDSTATGVDGDAANDDAVDSGAAYVFVRSGTAWSQQAYLKASNTGPGDRFGCGVAISGGTIVVGARDEDSNATGVGGASANDDASNSGAAYVFVRTGSVWAQQAYLKASNTGIGDQFGLAVAISGDTAVVGAYLEDSDAVGVDGDDANDDANNSGAAYVFVRTGAVWTQQGYLKASNTDPGDQFGVSVSVSGDSLVVGALGESSIATGVNGDQGDDSADFAGAAYVFTRLGTSWSQQAYLKASVQGFYLSALFGLSVCISGETIVVGAPEEFGLAFTPSDRLGGVYVFVASGGTWVEAGFVGASNRETGDRLGLTGVSIHGDTIVASAPGEDSAATGVNGDAVSNAASDSGAVYVFR